MRKNKGALIFIGFTLIILLGFVVLLSGDGNTSTQVQGATSNNVTMVDGKQLIEVTVAGGYSPQSINAKAGVGTVLRMKSVNAYGCDVAFRMPSLGISKTLPVNGNTDFDLGTQALGTKLTGTCSMGMYTFEIKFS